MPRSSTDTLLRERGTVLRAVGLGLAVALGVFGVVLIVKADATKYTQMGAIIMLWGLLLGSFVVYGVRRPAETAVPAGLGAELELRSQATEVESAREVRIRREAEARLQEILRQEIREAVNQEVGSLRSEISSLRTELLEKVGGQLRLEHIETTRVIGSDLEALQSEIRALKAAARAPRATARAGLLDATVVEREVVDRAVVDQPAAHPSVEPVQAEPTRAEPVQAEAVQAEPVQAEPVQAGQTRAELAAPVDESPHGTASPVRNGSSLAKAASSPPRVQPALAQAAPSTTTRTAQPLPTAPAPSRAPAPAAPAAQPSEPARKPEPTHTRQTRTRQTHTRQTEPERTQPAQAAEPQPAPPTSPAPDPARAERPGPPSGPAGGPGGQDPFADLPRLTPFVDDAPPTRKPPGRSTSTEPTYVRPPATPPEPPTYEGRRRREAAEHDATAPNRSNGDARAGSASNGSGTPVRGSADANGAAVDVDAVNGRRGVPAPERDTPGRRRRTEDAGDTDNLLARLLERERR